MPADWEARYQSGDMPWEKGEASPGLVDFLAAHPELPRGEVLVPGCGTGHDVRAWAAAGFKAVGCDLAPGAIERSRQKTPAHLPAEFLEADFLRSAPPRLFDWIFEHTLFCAIDPGERGLYESALLRWLKPNGNYLAVYYLIPDTDGPPFGTTRDEIFARFAPHFTAIAEWVPRSYPNRTGLELAIWWRRSDACA
jgi:ubiquinone/menaquinone biosynthesis C-methylase UbiE